MRRIRGEFLIILGAVLWGTTGTAQAFAPPEADPRSIGAIRLAIGGLALLVITLARGSSLRKTSWSLIPTLVAGISMAAYNLFFFAGVDKAGVAIGTIVTIGSAPVLAVLLEWLVRKERPVQRWYFATCLAIAGGIFLVIPGEKLSIDILGISLALLSGLSYAIFSVSSKSILATTPPDVAMAVVFSLGAILLSPILFNHDLHWISQPNGWASVLFLGLLSTSLAYILFARGLVNVPVSKAVTLTLAEPLTASTLGIVILRERLSIMGILGIGLIFAALVMLSVERK